MTAWFSMAMLALGLAGVRDATAQEAAGVGGPQHPEETQASASEPNRSGFTFELTLGFGLQIISPDELDSDTKAGISSLNLGIGGFFNPQVGLLFRTMGTVFFEEIAPGTDLTQYVIVAGPAVQYWPIDFVRLEGGVGFSVVTVEVSTEFAGADLTLEDDEGGWGLMFGAAGAFWQSQKHSLTLGFEYAPAFFDGATIHNLGFVFGWQLL